MLPTKRLVILATAFFALIPQVIFAQSAMSDSKLMTDEEALMPNTNGTACDKNPNEALKIMEEIERKQLCMAGLSNAECHALFLAGAAGGVGMAGTIASRKTLGLGELKVTADDVVCTDAVTQNFLGLIFPKAFAGMFCHIRSRSPLNQSIDNVARRLRAERDEAMDHSFKSAELREEVPGQSVSDLKRKVQASEDTITKLAEKYREQLKTGNVSSSISEEARTRAIKNLDQAIKTKNFVSMNALMDLTSNSYFPSKNIVNIDELIQVSRQRDLAINALQRSDKPGFPAAQVADRTEKIKNMKLLLLDSALGEDYLKQRMKAISPDINVDEIMKNRKSWLDLSRASGNATNLGFKFSVGEITEDEVYKEFAKIQFQASKNPEIPLLLEDVVKMAKSHWLAAGKTLKQIDLLEVMRVLRAKGGVVLLTAGKAALAANPADVIIQGITFMPANGTCLYNIATDSAEGRNKFAMAGYNYMELDRETCKPIVKLDHKFMNFLNLEPVSRLKMARYNPKLCSLIYDLSKKEFIGNNYQIMCQSNSSFRMIEPTLPNLGEKVAREMAAAKLSEQEKVDYLKLNPKFNFNHTVEVKGDNFSINYTNPTKPLQSCKNFVVNSFSNAAAETHSRCYPLTSKVSENIYEYAQIAKCCAGEAVSYCDAFKKNFIQSALPIHDTKPNGGRTQN